MCKTMHTGVANVARDGHFFAEFVPLARLTQCALHLPRHCRYTHFDLPGMPAGTSNFVTVTNGIPSNAVSVVVH